MFRYRKMVPIFMASIICLGLHTSAFANENALSESVSSGSSNSLETQTAKAAFSDIKEQIIKDYGELYTLDDFSYDYKVRNDQGKKYLDINVYVDMTLTRHPSQSPYVLGMQKALNEMEESFLKKELQDEVDSYVKEIETLYFNIPDSSTFTYAVELNDDNGLRTMSSETDYKLFYRTDTDEEILLADADNLAEVENFDEVYQSGYQAMEKLEADAETSMLNSESTVNTQASVSYDRLAARDWAFDNWNATPEYPSSTVAGTDCANFVSKALNAGGIPEDKSGKWYRAATWGGWPGDHWFRTGYNGQTGVVIYMKNKGYFYKESDESVIAAGCIMYWNNTSHVALVTAGDGVTIKYTQHGASQTKNTVYKKSEVSASFYKASKSIV